MRENVPAIISCHNTVFLILMQRLRRPHGKGLLIYFTDDPYGRYNYSGRFDRGEIDTANGGGGVTFYRNGDSYKGNYARETKFPEGRGSIRQEM